MDGLDLIKDLGSGAMLLVALIYVVRVLGIGQQGITASLNTVRDGLKEVAETLVRLNGKIPPPKGD